MPDDASRPMRRRRRIFLGALVVLLAAILVGVAGFLWWAQPQPLLPEATEALASTPDASFRQGEDGRLEWTPTAAEPTTGLVLYTGGKVPPAAYAPAARAIAEAGYLVAIVPAPFNLAIFDTGAAQAVIDDHPAITVWAVGGHSLGGASAALFVDGHAGLVDGLALWASYSSSDLADDGVIVSSSYGTLDPAAPTFTDPVNVAKLGPVRGPRRHRGRQPRADGLVHRPTEPPARDDQPPRAAGPDRGGHDRATPRHRGRHSRPDGRRLLPDRGHDLVPSATQRIADAGQRDRPRRRCRR